jgi:hypothetical protein
LTIVVDRPPIALMMPIWFVCCVMSAVNVLNTSTTLMNNEMQASTCMTSVMPSTYMRPQCLSGF